MDCSCIKGEGSFNFELKTISPYSLSYTDLSDWMEHPNYKAPSNYKITLSTPNGSDVEVEIDALKANLIKSKEIFGSDIEIPDGIYCVTLENCGYKYMKHVAIVRQLECCADKLFMEYKDTKEIDDLIRMIKVATEFKNISVAQELYKKVNQIIKDNQCYC